MKNRASTEYVIENVVGALKIAEIGVWRGDNAISLMGLELDRLYLIDPYKEYKRRKQDELDSAMGEALPKIISHKMSMKTSFMRMESLEAAEYFKDGYFDFVYIDGDHSQESVTKDLHAWWPKVKKGGVFAGHDYSVSIGVEKAVKQFCDEKKIKLHTWRKARDKNVPLHKSDWMILKES